MDELLKITGAIYDETRVAILAFLDYHGECCVCELSASLGLGQSRLSRHLGILYDAGFVDTNRNGKWVYYSIRQNAGALRFASLEHIRSLNISQPAKINACEIEK